MSNVTHPRAYCSSANRKRDSEIGTNCNACQWLELKSFKFKYEIDNCLFILDSSCQTSWTAGLVIAYSCSSQHQLQIMKRRLQDISNQDGLVRVYINLHKTLSWSCSLVEIYYRFDYDRAYEMQRDFNDCRDRNTWSTGLY